MSLFTMPKKYLRKLLLPTMLTAFAFSLAPQPPLQAQMAQFNGAQSTVRSGLGATPYGVAVDGSGNIYIATYTLQTILKETPAPSGGYTESVIPNSAVFPAGVAVDGSGNIYIADSGPQIVNGHMVYGGGQILKETPLAGSYIESVVRSGLNSPDGVAVDMSGNIYISNSALFLSQTEVLKEVPSGAAFIESVVATGNGDPAGLAVDGQGDVYVAYQQSNQVLKWTPSAQGYTPSTVASNLDPFGVAVDANYNVYVANTAFHTVLKEAPSTGGYTQSVVPIFNLSSNLSYPFGLALDKNGVLYITDVNHGLVLKLQTGTIDFGALQVGTTSPATSLLVTVNSAGSLGTPQILGGDFTNAGTGTCNTTTSYNPGDICTIDVIFSPTTSGLRTGTVNLLGPANNVIATVAIEGTGQARLDFSPSPANFGNIVVGTTSAPITITVTNNTSSYPRYIDEFYLHEFNFMGGTCGPIDPNTTLAPGASCTFSVTFSPTALGPVNGSFTLGTADGNITYNLTGTGVPIGGGIRKREPRK
ncbi:MAG TPA: choice-of-anchor D domain-containing protein [Acidisarcina sp.]